MTRKGVIMSVKENNMANNIKYIDEWKREHVRFIRFYINKDKEKDVLEHFEKQANKRAYLVDLIRKDMDGLLSSKAAKSRKG